MRNSHWKCSLTNAWTVFTVPALVVCVVLTALPLLAQAQSPEPLAEAEALREQGRWQEALDVLLDVVNDQDADAATSELAGVRTGRYLIEMVGIPAAATQLQNVRADMQDEARSALWANAFMADVLVNTVSVDGAMDLCDGVVKDRVTGAADKQQAVCASIWHGWALLLSEGPEEALASFQMAGGVASEDHPALVHEADFLSGEACRMLGELAWQQNQDGETRGLAHQQALRHYLSAFKQAESLGLGETEIDRARLQAASEMHHLGMREKGIAFLRVGIDNPANPTTADSYLIARMVLFMWSPEDEQWQAYQNDPASYPDPTATWVREGLATVSAPNSTQRMYVGFMRAFWRNCLHDKGQELLSGQTPDAQSMVERTQLDRFLLALDRKQLLDAYRILEQVESTNWTQSPEMKAWGTMMRGELVVRMGHHPRAITYLEQAITEAGFANPEPKNWARVRLAECLTQTGSMARVETVVDDVIADHAANNADDRQLAWALIWKARSLIERQEFDQALTPLQMAAAVADQNHPELAYEAQFVAGDTCRLKGEQAWNEAKDEETRGESHIAAFEHYQAAFVYAQQANADLDRPRLAVATEMHHLGMRQRAIAWLRQGIPDPGSRAHTDIRLASRMVSFMTKEEARAWHEHLVSPEATPDPTQSLVQAEFGEDAPQTSSLDVRNAFNRRLWLGKLYARQDRREEAKNQLQAALAGATVPEEEARALTGLVEVYANEAKEHRRARRLPAAQEIVSQAEPLADQAAGIWLNLARGGGVGEAHHATEAAVEAYRDLGLHAKALGKAEEFLATLQADGSEDKVAFAQYMRARALAWNKRYAEAIQAVEVLDAQYGASDSPAIKPVCAHAIVFASAYHVWNGDLSSASNVLDEAERRYPDRAMKPLIAECRKLIDIHTQSSQE